MPKTGKATDPPLRRGGQFAKCTTDAAVKNAIGTPVSDIRGRFPGNQADQNEHATGEQENAAAVSLQAGGGETQKITVLVADDHPMVREGLVALINRRADMRVVAEASNGREAVDKYFVEHPEVTLLDVRMSVMGGIEAAVSIRDQDPTARIVVISSYEREEEIYRALRAGALGYVLKNSTVTELVECIRTVGSGKTWIPPCVAGKLAKRVADQDLTRREGEVLRAVCEGKSNKEIGAAFDISEATVKVHMTHILEKLKVSSRTEAIHVAVKRGLVRMDETAA